MRYVSLFSGIEAATHAWHPLGWHCVAVAEIEQFPCHVLAHHYPNTPNLGDVTALTEDDVKRLGQVDVLVFGSPCQDLSVAGKRKGLYGERSGLFFTAMRIADWMREHCGLRWALWENVPGAFSSNKGRDFAAVVDRMAGVVGTPVPPKGWGNEGVAIGEKALVEWSTLDAQWFGVAQRRRRVFALADFGNWAGRPPVLLEPQGLRGDSAPSRETGKSVTRETAPCLTSSGRGVERTGETRGQDPVIAVAFGGNNQSGPIDVATTLNACASASGRMDFETETFLVQPAYTLRSEGFDASEDGTRRGTPLVPAPFDTTQITSAANYSNHELPETVGPLMTHHTPKGHGCAGVNNQAVASGHILPVVAFDTTQITSAANRSNPKPGDPCHPCHPLAAGAHAPSIAFDSRQDCVHSYEVFGALSSSLPQAQAVTTRWEVRRLTPRECERLQGFRDDFTAVPSAKGKPAADGPRYKALGNSKAVPVIQWIGKSIEFAHLYF